MFISGIWDSHPGHAFQGDHGFDWLQQVFWKLPFHDWPDGNRLGRFALIPLHVEVNLNVAWPLTKSELYIGQGP